MTNVKTNYFGDITLFGFFMKNIIALIRYNSDITQEFSGGLLNIFQRKVLKDANIQELEKNYTKKKIKYLLLIMSLLK